MKSYGHLVGFGYLGMLPDGKKQEFTTETEYDEILMEEENENED